MVVSGGSTHAGSSDARVETTRLRHSHSASWRNTGSAVEPDEICIGGAGTFEAVDLAE